MIETQAGTVPDLAVAFFNPEHPGIFNLISRVFSGANFYCVSRLLVCRDLIGLLRIVWVCYVNWHDCKHPIIFIFLTRPSSFWLILW